MKGWVKWKICYDDASNSPSADFLFVPGHKYIWVVVYITPELWIHSPAPWFNLFLMYSRSFWIGDNKLTSKLFHGLVRIKKVFYYIHLILCFLEYSIISLVQISLLYPIFFKLLIVYYLLSWDILVAGSLLVVVAYLWFMIAIHFMF